MAEQKLNTRIITKHGQAGNTNLENFKPKKGELVLIQSTDGTRFALKAGIDNEITPLSSIPYVYNPEVEEQLTTINQRLDSALGESGSVYDQLISELENLIVTPSNNNGENGVVVDFKKESGHVKPVLKKLGIADITTLEDKLNNFIESEDYNRDQQTTSETLNGINTSIGTINEKLDGLTNVLHFRGAVSATTEIEDPSDGDLIVISSGSNAGKEYVYSNSAWVELGYTDGIANEISTHTVNLNNPHSVTKAQVGLSNVDNKSAAELKSQFTGAVAVGSTGFALGKDVYSAIDTMENELEGAISTINTNYIRRNAETNELVWYNGSTESTIVFDCGELK